MVILLVAGYFCCSCAYAGSTVTVGDPSNPGGLDSAINAAYAGGASTVVVATGTYTLTAGDSIKLKGLSGVTLSCYGCTFYSTDTAWYDSIFFLDHCTDVDIEGGTVTCSTVSMWETKITGVADKTHYTAAQVAGYPAPPTGTGKGCWLIGGGSRQYETQTSDFGCTIASTDLDTYNIAITQGGIVNAPTIGDYIVGRSNESPYHISLSNCTQCELKDIVLYANGFASLREDVCTSDTFQHLIWAGGPPPPGAVDPPLFSCGADGTDALADYIGPIYENCQMFQLLNDDDIAIHGYTSAVNTVDGSTVTFKDSSLAEGNVLVVGQSLRFADDKFYAQAMVEAVGHAGGLHTVTLDKDYSIPADAHAFNPNVCGANYKIIDCFLGGTRARGIIAKADNGWIEGNTIASSIISAVRIGSDGWNDEAGFASDVEVIGNYIDGFGSYDGAVHVGNPGAIGNFNYRIENNLITDPGGPAVTVEGASGVVISNNTFRNTAQYPTDMDEHLLRVQHSENVTMTDNLLINRGQYAATPFYDIDSRSTDVDTSGVETADNGIDPEEFCPYLAQKVSVESSSGRVPSNGWTISAVPMDSAYVARSTDSVDGDASLRFNCSVPLHAKALKVISGLNNGPYRLTAYVRNGGNMTHAFLFATGYGRSAVTLRENAPLTTGTWSKITIDNIPVSNGQCTVGVYGLAAKANTTFDVDNVILVRLFAAPAQIDLSANFNDVGIAFVSDNSVSPEAQAYALHYADMANGLTWHGEHFRLGDINNYNVVACDGSAVAFRPCPYAFSKMYVLAASDNGALTNQSFSVNYDTGAPDTFTQSFSDWSRPSEFIGESVAKIFFAGFNTAQLRRGSAYLYGYTFPLDKTRSPLGIILPMNKSLKILAITLVP